MRTSPWALIPLAVVSTSAHATAYLTVEQAQRAIFPGATFAATGQPNVWRTSNGGVFVVDRVVGKHEFITPAPQSLRTSINSYNERERSTAPSQLGCRDCTPAWPGLPAWAVWAALPTESC